LILTTRFMRSMPLPSTRAYPSFHGHCFAQPNLLSSSRPCSIFKARSQTFIHISDGKLHDVNVLDLLIPEPDTFYIMDRSYVDFERLFTLHRTGRFSGASPFFAKLERGSVRFRVQTMGQRPLPSAARVRSSAHSERHQDSRNDLTPCRMAWHFVSAGTHAPHSDQTLGPTLTRARAPLGAYAPSLPCASPTIVLLPAPRPFSPEHGGRQKRIHPLQDRRKKAMRRHKAGRF